MTSLLWISAYVMFQCGRLKKVRYIIFYVLCKRSIFYKNNIGNEYLGDSVFSVIRLEDREESIISDVDTHSIMGKRNRIYPRKRFHRYTILKVCRIHIVLLYMALLGHHSF